MYYAKYYKEEKMISRDSGVTWVTANQYRKGALYEQESLDCDEGEGIEEWRVMDISLYWICEGNDKYYQEMKWKSYDNGASWQPTYEYRTGTLYETNSTDCGGVSPTPTPSTPKFKAWYSDSTEYSAACDSSSSLTTTTTKAHSTPYSAMTRAIIGTCVTEVGLNCFVLCVNLSDVAIPNTVTTIGEASFYYCSSLTSITIPNSVTSIGTRAFCGCSGLTTVTIPDSVTSIGQGAFMDCRQATTLNLNDSLTAIPQSLFANCYALTSLTIPESVTSIGERAFIDAHSLRTVVIPSGVTYIGRGAFSNCSARTSITVLATTPPTLTGQAFAYTNNCPIYVPSQSVNAYKAAQNWDYYADRIFAIP